MNQPIEHSGLIGALRIWVPVGLRTWHFLAGRVGGELVAAMVNRLIPIQPSVDLVGQRRRL